MGDLGKMSNRQIARWQLPEVIDPPDRLCAVISVPNDRYHIAAFFGALYNLAVWQYWERDPLHKGTEVAQVWWQIYQDIKFGDCSLIGGDDVQFRQNGCKLEFSIDCVHWMTLYDPTECITGLIQPAGGGILPAGQCREFDVQLSADKQFLLPFPVNSGYTIEVTGATGAWADGAAPFAYKCPNGSAYFLGICTGETITNPADPIPTAPHMTLITRLDTVGPQFFEILTGIYTIPAGVTAKQLSFQANDSDLSGGQGAVSFHVKVCAPLAAGCVLQVGSPQEIITDLGGGKFRISVNSPNGSSGGVDFYQTFFVFKSSPTSVCCRVYQFTALTGWNNCGITCNNGEVFECDGTHTVFSSPFAPGVDWIENYAAAGFNPKCMQSIGIKSSTPFSVEFVAADCA